MFEILGPNPTTDSLGNPLPRRSKVSKIPNVCPVQAMSVREVLRMTAAVKALRALRRHGEKSFQFFRAYKSRWLRV